MKERSLPTETANRPSPARSTVRGGARCHPGEVKIASNRNGEPPATGQGEIFGGALTDQHDAPSGRDAPQPRFCTAKPQRAHGHGQRFPHDARRRTHPERHGAWPRARYMLIPARLFVRNGNSAPGSAPPAWPATTADRRALAARRAAGPLGAPARSVTRRESNARMTCRRQAPPQTSIYGYFL